MKLSDMKIVAGLGSLDAFDAYVGAGADELFAGFIPAEWLERYGVVSPLNRREVLLYPTQIASMADMRTLSRLSQEANVPVSLTINATFYAPEQYQAIRNLIDSLLDIGFSRFILADPALLLYLRRTGCRARVHLSGEMGAFGVPALYLLDGPDVSRIILHRKTGLDEMAKIARAFPDRELEAFVLNERCYYTGALCNSLHADELPHLCRVSGEIAPVYDAPASPAFSPSMPPCGNASALFCSADAPCAAPCGDSYGCSRNTDAPYRTPYGDSFGYSRNTDAPYTTTCEDFSSCSCNADAPCTSPCASLSTASYHANASIAASREFLSTATSHIDGPTAASCERFSCAAPHANAPSVAPCEHPSDAPSGESADPDALGASGCGLCALPALCRAGVTHLKLVGRGNRPERMARDIRALKTALSLSEPDFPAEMKRCLFPNGCSGACYYRI